MADTPLNPQAPTTNGAPVNAINPLPCAVHSAGAPATDKTLNPVIWVVDGSLVSATNPLPIILA